jgi:16S rRNA G966 N2-methylase RsmD
LSRYANRVFADFCLKELKKEASAASQAEAAQAQLVCNLTVASDDCVHWLRTYNGDKPALILTDPPFNIIRDSDGKLVPSDTLDSHKRKAFVRQLSRVAQPDYTVLLLFCDIREYGLWTEYAHSHGLSILPVFLTV